MLRRAPFDKIGVTPTPDFQNADPANGIAGSIVNGLIFNDLQHEGENLELLAGLTPSGTDLTQWAQAVSRGGIWAGNLTGTGDLAVATLGVVIPDLLQGMRVGAIATATNTVTNPKLRVINKGTQGGYTDYPILKEDGSALAIGDIKAGRRYRYEADGAGNVLISGGGIGTASSGSAAGRLNTVVPFLTAGSIAPYTVPAGVTLIGYVLIGGGGGGSGNTGSAGGGGGAVLGFMTVTPGSTLNGVVGAAGTGASSGTAGNGGATTLSGSGASAGGGNGGGVGGSPGTGGTATGGLIQFTGGPGEDLDSTQYFAQGGTSLGMPSGRYSAGVNPGDGGGASSPSGSPANTGYNGAPGAIIFF